MAEDNITRLPVTSGPRPLGAIVQNVVAAVVKAKQQRDMLRQAHAAAARFHEAIAEAIEAEEEMEGDNADPYWAEKYKREIGKAGAAIRDMPIKWQAVLQCELPTPPEAA